MGPTGPAGSFSTANAAFLQVSQTQSEQTLVANNAVAFDTLLVQVGNIGIVVGTSEICIWQAGYYQVQYSLSPNLPCQFSIFLNGVLLPGSTVGVSQSLVPLAACLLFAVSASDFTQTTPLTASLVAILTIVNYTSIASPVTLLRSMAGVGAQPNQACATATVILLKEL